MVIRFTHISVVYHLVPTSNHNCDTISKVLNLLFIILFLHQTTTMRVKSLVNFRCLSSCSYIKPQLRTICPLRLYRCLSSCSYIKPQQLFQNIVGHFSCLSSCSYIKPQRGECEGQFCLSCLSSCSYIKPQQSPLQLLRDAGCLSSCSYIKPQPIAVNLLAISKILRFELLRNGRAGRFLLQIY